MKILKNFYIYLKIFPISLQHLFSMFGSTILVPILFHIDPATILLFNGIGTIFYILICKGKVPAYLGSSFAFISPVFIVLPLGYEIVLGGFVFSGILLCFIAFLVKIFGIKWLKIIFPPVIMGSVILVIGLDLLHNSSFSNLESDINNTNIFLITLITTIIISLLPGFISSMSILIGIFIGYLSSFFIGIINFQSIIVAPWFKFPNFYFPHFSLIPILVMLPSVLIVLIENISHLTIIDHIIKKDLLKNPGLHRSIFSNGISTVLSGFFGSTPNTTYAENIGVLTYTKIYNTKVIIIAAILAIFLAFSGKLSAIIYNIPLPIINGISFLLYGTISCIGIRILIDSKIDYNKIQNLILTSIILIFGISGIKIKIYSIEFKGMILSTLISILLNLIFKIFSYFNHIKKLIFKEKNVISSG